MSIQDEKFIKVYNKNNFVVSVTSREKPYVFAPIRDGVATMIPMTWEEIAYIHSSSSAFQRGLLCFEDDKQEEAMETLGIMNWRDIISNDEFEEIVKNPTADGVQKILAITEMSTFERLRGIFYSLKNAGYDMSTRIEKIIEERFKELLNGKITSRIVVTPKNLAPVSHEDMSDIKAKNEQLNAELEALKAQMAMLMSSMASTTAAPAEAEAEPVAAKKPTTRKKAAAK